jgi:phenylacetate 2-hydroxylase
MSAVSLGFAGLVVLVVIKLLNTTDIPKIKGVVELPGVPVFGNVLQLGSSHANACRKLAARFGPIFQLRLGNRVQNCVCLREDHLTDSRTQRFVYVNSFDAIRDLWIGHNQSLISRTSFWTFHSVASSSKGPTLATSPWSERTKRVRKAAATALNRNAIQTYLPSIDLETTTNAKDIQAMSKDGADVDPTLYFQRSSLNMALRVSYGFRLQGTVTDEKIREVVDVERELSLLRGIAHCWQDYIPIMRLWPGYRTHAIRLRDRRDSYLGQFFEQLKHRVSIGTDVPSVTGNMMKDPEAKLSDGKLCLFSYRLPY